MADWPLERRTYKPTSQPANWATNYLTDQPTKQPIDQTDPPILQRTQCHGNQTKTCYGVSFWTKAVNWLAENAIFGAVMLVWLKNIQTFIAWQKSTIYGSVISKVVSGSWHLLSSLIHNESESLQTPWQLSAHCWKCMTKPVCANVYVCLTDFFSVCCSEKVWFQQSQRTGVGKAERDKRFKEKEVERRSIKLFLVDTAAPLSRHFASDEAI